MIIIGHKFIESEKFSPVLKVDDIAKTSSNSTIFIKFSEENIEVVKFAVKNGVEVAIKVSNSVEAILSEALRVKYIVANFENSVKIQEIADNYMFDAKILTIIENELEIEKVAHHKIDGVIFKSSLNRERN
jgi:hypothetical protein